MFQKKEKPAPKKKKKKTVLKSEEILSNFCAKKSGIKKKEFARFRVCNFANPGQKNQTLVATCKPQNNKIEPV